MSDTETLCKLYLELSNVVPRDCITQRELLLTAKLDQIKGIISGHGTPSEKLGRVAIVTGNAMIAEAPNG